MTIMVIVCDLLMLATGLISAAVPWKPYKAMKKVWFLFSCLFYILMVVVLQTDVSYKASKQVEVAATLFKRLEVLTVAVWSFYPVVVMMGRAHLGLITKPMEDILLCVLDVVAKIGMEGLIVASCFNGCLGDYDSH
jgi:bacteriorhodopsin